MSTMLPRKNKKLLLIVNPKAGMGTNEAKFGKLIAMLDRAGYDVIPYLTQYSKHSTRLVLEHGGDCDLIVCTGGDGTLSEVVSGAVQLENRPMIGYIPLGTTNDYAKSFKLPRTLTEAVKTIAAEKTLRVDYGVFNGSTTFIYVASFGAFTKVSYATPQDAKNVLGRGAYMFDGLRSLGDIRPYHAKVITDGETYEDDYVFASVTNATVVGGVMQLPVKEAELSDGKFEVLLIKNPSNIQKLSDTVFDLINSDFDNGRVTLTRSTKLKIEFSENTPFTTDGEYAGNFPYVSIENVKQGINLIVP